MTTSAPTRRPVLLLALALLLVGIPAAPASALDELSFAPWLACPEDEVPPRFTDTGPPHGPSADCLAWYDIARGRTETAYDPGAPITRGQAMSLLHRLLGRLDGIELPPPDDGAFPDVTGGPHADAIETMAAIDPPVVRGHEDGRFRPQSGTTRGQLATVVARTLDEIAAQQPDLEPLPEAGSPFTDTAGSPHEGRIARLAEAGVLAGYGDGTFGPGDRVTRGQLATILARVLGAMVDAGLTSPPQSTPPDLDVELALTRVATMDAPIAGAVGPEGVLHLAERDGRVRPLTDQGLGPAIVDVDVSTGGERGLLGLAFAPDGRELYLSYTDPAGDTVVEALAYQDGEVDESRRRTIFTRSQPASNHNGGQLHLGPDGMLYLALGDGGADSGNGQDTSTTLGSLLRLDPTAAHPDAAAADNPFVGRAGADEIYAYGLRNPWRFSFDRQTDDLWIADVGASAREEVNWLPDGDAAGANLGWDAMEGTVAHGTEPDGHVPPVHEYGTHTGDTCAVTGGYVYRGRAIAELRGAYLYSDLCDGEVRGLVLEDGEVVDTGALGIAGAQVVSFAQDAAGELYLLDFDGSVERIDPA